MNPVAAAELTRLLPGVADSGRRLLSTPGPMCQPGLAPYAPVKFKLGAGRRASARVETGPARHVDLPQVVIPTPTCSDTSSPSRATTTSRLQLDPRRRSPSAVVVAIQHAADAHPCGKVGRPAALAPAWRSGRVGSQIWRAWTYTRRRREDHDVDWRDSNPVTSLGEEVKPEHRGVTGDLPLQSVGVLIEADEPRTRLPGAGGAHRCTDRIRRWRSA